MHRSPSPVEPPPTAPGGMRAGAAAGPVSLARAREIVAEAARAATGAGAVGEGIVRERVSLPRALGRVLAEDVLAGESLPPFDGSAMDGFAVRAADVAGASAERAVCLRVAGESRAGHPRGEALREGEAVAISTGAALPPGADAVVRVEDARRGDWDDGDGDAAVWVSAAVRPGRDVRRRGEDVREGRLVLAAGSVLGPAELGALAAVGHARPLCARRPLVRVLTSGDELVDAGAAGLDAGQIRDSSAHAIPALARRAGAEVAGVAHVRDDPDAVREALAACLEEADVAVVCGGVSVGEHDHVKGALAELGVEQLFAGVALRPGKPAWFGRRERTLVFALPGNPVSSIAVFCLLAAPALRLLSGERQATRTVAARLAADREKPAGLAQAVPARLSVDGSGGLVADPLPRLGSHLVVSLAGANAFALMAPERTLVRAGETVEVELLGGPL